MIVNILSGIWQNAPVWVWPLFVVLIVIGVMAMKSRDSSIVPYFFYPLFGLTAANAVAGLVHSPVNWNVFAGFYLVGVGMAFRWQDGLILKKTGWKMRLKGDRVTLLILMIIFCSNFANGVFQAVAPHLLQGMVYTVVFAAVIGACSGSFMGRALRVVTLKQRNALLL